MSRRGGPTPADVNPAWLAKQREEIERQLGTSKPKSIAVSVVPDLEPAPRRLKQRTRKISLLEQRWGVELRSRYPNARIYDQFPLNIGNGCNYYVDYLIVLGGRDRVEPLEIIGHEVKGPYARSTGIVKAKAAATRYPWITFALITEVSRNWRLEAILP